MSQPQTPNGWMREELLHLLSVSGTLAGLCITVVALMKALGGDRITETIVDDMFAACAALFLISIYLIFWALRTRKPAITTILTRAVDRIFLLALTLMTVAAFILIYTIW